MAVGYCRAPRSLLTFQAVFHFYRSLIPTVVMAVGWAWLKQKLSISEAIFLKRNQVERGRRVGELSSQVLNAFNDLFRENPTTHLWLSQTWTKFTICDARKLQFSTMISTRTKTFVDSFSKWSTSSFRAFNNLRSRFPFVI